MKIVVVLAQPPAPEGSAAGRCGAGLLEALASNGMEVAAVAPRRPFSLASPVPNNLPVTLVDVAPRHRGLLGRLRAPLADLVEDEGFAAAVEDVAVDADLVHLEEIETGWLGFRSGPARSLIHVHHSVWLDGGPRSPHSTRGRFALEGILAERRLTRRHPHLLANSPVVADFLGRVAPAARVHVVPLTVVSEAHQPAVPEGAVAGMIGTYAWPPTAAAFRRLLARVWPAVRTRAPAARLLVAGRGTEAIGARYAGVTVLGEVAQTAAFMARLSCLLYPIARGSGMKVKTLEALACGVPVVTTPAGAEGVPGSDGVIVCERDEALAEAAASLLTVAAEAQERGAAARRTFLEHLAPDVVGRRLRAVYEQVLT